MARRKKRLKKKVIIPLILIIVLLFITIISSIYSKKTIVLIDNIEISINEEAYNTDIIKEIKNGEIITTKKLINTSSLGEQEIKITIKDSYGKQKEYKAIVRVYDRELPVITYNKELITTKGKKIDLLKDVSATDNSKEELSVKVIGTYDFNEQGTYKLLYVAKDSSNNEAREEFTLTVKDKISNNSSTTKPSNEEKPNTSEKPVDKPSNNEDGTFTTKKGFKGEVKNGITYIDGILIANKTYGLPSTYGNGLTKTTTDAFNKMQAAAKLDGFNIYIASGFRSYQTQEKLYNNYVKNDGKKNADTYSARPGHSEHQTGIAFDVCHNGYGCINSTFNNTPPANWLANNCYKYGFILRYPKGKTNETGYIYESWHFRYVGVELAEKLYNNGDWITLESYFGITSNYE